MANAPATAEAMVPPEFSCPIMHEVMTDPVSVVPCGHTMQREAAENWWRTGKTTCPLCNLPCERRVMPALSLANIMESKGFKLKEGRNNRVSSAARPPPPPAQPRQAVLAAMPPRLAPWLSMVAADDEVQVVQPPPAAAAARTRDTSSGSRRLGVAARDIVRDATRRELTEIQRQAEQLKLRAAEVRRQGKAREAEAKREAKQARAEAKAREAEAKRQARLSRAAAQSAQRAQSHTQRERERREQEDWADAAAQVMMAIANDALESAFGPH